jgi:sugar lactone lactonase YvrE
MHLMKTLLSFSAAVVLLGSPLAPRAHAARPPLTPVAESREMIWNGVAVDDQGRVLVSGPRWTGSQGPSVAELDAQGKPVPFPDAAWNDWQPGKDPGKGFINVNAIHRGEHNDLWVIDTGASGFGGNVIPGGAKLVRIDLKTRKVARVYVLGPEIAAENSYVDDIRFHGQQAYLTDAGRPGIIVLNVETGAARRVLDNSPFTSAPDNRPITVGGKTVLAPDGQPLKVNADPLEVSPDGRWFYFAPLEGPLYRIETRWLDDPSIDPATLASKVEKWFDLPPVGGTAMDRQGNLYFTELATHSLRKLTPDRRVETVFTDPRLHWTDAPYLDRRGTIWLPVPQMDRVALFNNKESKIEWPIRLYRLDLPKP